MDLIRQIGGFDETLRWGEDLDFILRLAERARAVGVDKTLLQVREHDGRTTFGDHGVHIWWTRVSDRGVDRSDDPRIRRLYGREVARHLIILAGYRLRQGRYWEALRLSLIALGRRPLWLATWTGLAKRLGW